MLFRFASPRMRHHPILRCLPGSSHDNHHPYLPDEIITHIISTVCPTELIAFRWIGVNTGFDRIVEDHIKNNTSCNVCEDFLWRYLQPQILTGNSLRQSHRNLLQLVITRYFRYVQEFVVPVALFAQMHSILEQMFAKDSGIAMPVLDRITVQIGEEWGPLLVSHNFDNLKVGR
ncbi:hypothetical protein Y032_0006g2932 [Ancylostoma ceylanicum]|uniref:F-box domain-containing protein n=1 Tax=Ancylostoma ceylanicum TaxID=53326 RepID=A0A016VRE0_9BILA|nr:hypothetical protein Y032_0006g2932 [Ancylostoma ceylanicum]